MIYALWLLMFCFVTLLVMVGLCFVVGVVAAHVAVLVSAALIVVAWLTAEKINEWEEEQC